MVQVGNATAQGLTTPLAGLQLSHSWAFTHLYLASPGILGHLCSKMSAWILGLKSARKQHTEKYATFSRFFCAFFTFFSLNFFAQKWKNEKASEKMKKQLNKIQKTSEKMKNRVKKWNTGEKNECKTSEFSYWIMNCEIVPWNSTSLGGSCLSISKAAPVLEFTAPLYSLGICALTFSGTVHLWLP